MPPIAIRFSVTDRALTFARACVFRVQVAVNSRASFPTVREIWWCVTVPSKVQDSSLSGPTKALILNENCQPSPGVKIICTTHSPTTGPSATFVDNPSSSFRPSHFRFFFFLPLDPAVARRFSPPAPIHILPSAVPAATMPVEDTAVDKTNGGESDTPDSGGGVAV